MRWELSVFGTCQGEKRTYSVTAEESKTVKACFISGSVLAVFSHHCGKRPNTNNLEREERSCLAHGFGGSVPGHLATCVWAGHHGGGSGWQRYFFMSW